MSLPLESSMETTATPRHRLPLAVKLGYTAFMAVLVPVYWANYGPTNFLYFCDVALFLTLFGLWSEKSLPISMAAVGIMIPQALWIADFTSNLLGAPLLGMTDYMFEETNPLFNRSLSLFHGWLPLLLIWLVARVGYDQRAALAWVITAWGLLVACYLWMPAPPADPLDPLNCDKPLVPAVPEVAELPEVADEPLFAEAPFVPFVPAVRCIPCGP